MSTSGAAAVLSRVIEETLSQRDHPIAEEEQRRFIHPSALAKGCLLAIAFELQGRPKAPVDNRVKRILQVGSSSHYRIPRYLERLIVAQELPFADEEFMIRGRCDALLFIPPDVDRDLTGFYVLEIKTTSSVEFQTLKQARQPKPEHVTQCLLYIWGVQRYYRAIPINKGLIYYENRDTLDYMLFEVDYSAARLQPLLQRVKSMLAGLAEGKLPVDDVLPTDHWYHRFCPYLEICEYGQRALQQQKGANKETPDTVVAQIIAERIVAKRRAGELVAQKSRRRKGPRSLELLALELGWD